MGIDNHAGGHMAAEYLAKLGHRNIAILTMPLSENGPEGLVGAGDVRKAPYADTRDRAAGYFDALAEAGIDIDAIPIFATRNDEATARAAVAAILAAAHRPTAILAQSDLVALAVIRILGEQGLKVPEDVSIIGFDGTPEGAIATPSLTTIAQPMRDIGRAAVSAILTASQGVQSQALPLELVIRGSTAPPAAVSKPKASASSR